MVVFEQVSSFPDPDAYLNDSNIIYIGSAGIGKSEEILSEDDVQRIETLSELNSPFGRYVALDDFYSVFMEYRQSEDTELKHRFEQLLERSSGVCLVTRPRSFDWLLQHTSFECDIENQVVLEKVYSTEEAINEASNLLKENVPQQELENKCDLLTYTYNYDSTLLDDRSYSSPVPQLVLQSNQYDSVVYPAEAHDSDGSIVSTAKELGGEFARSAGYSEVKLPSRGEVKQSAKEGVDSIQAFMSNYQDELGDLTKQAGQYAVPATAMSLVGGVGSTILPVAAPILLGTMLGSDQTLQTREEIENQFEGLFDPSVLPPTKCRVEDELGLPPMTLEYLQTITQPAFHAKLKSVIDSTPELESELDDLSDDVETLDSELGSVAARSRRVEAFISSALSTATESLDTVRSDLCKLERSYLRIDGKVPLEDQPLYGIDLEEWYTDLAQSNGIFVLRGPHGTGKTTVAYRLCKKLAANGHAVKRPNFRDSDISFIRKAFSGIDQPTVCYLNYQIGPNNVSQDDLLSSIRLLENDVIDYLIIECRDEVFPKLNNTIRARATNTRPGNRSKKLWKRGEIKSLPQLSETQIEELATWVGVVKDEKEAVTSAVDEIIAVAEKNPELAKIAARLVATGHDLRGIQTEDDLIWEDIEDLVAFEDGPREVAVREIVRWLAVTRGLSEDTLETLAGVSSTPFEDAKEALSTYLVKETDGQLRLTPDIYQEVIFRGECLKSLDSHIYDLVAEDLESVLPAVALNLGLVASGYHASPRTPRDNEQRLNECKFGCQVLFDELSDVEDAYLYTEAAENVAQSPLELPPSIFESEQLVAGIIDKIISEATDARQRGHKIVTLESKPNLRFRRLLSGLISSHVLAESAGDVKKYLEIGEEGYKRLEESKEEIPSFMIHYRDEFSCETESEFLLDAFAHGVGETADYQSVSEVVSNIKTSRKWFFDWFDRFFGGEKIVEKSDNTLSTSGNLNIKLGFTYDSAVMVATANYIKQKEETIEVLDALTDQIATYIRKNTRGSQETPRLVPYTKSRTLANILCRLVIHYEYSAVEVWPNAIESMIEKEVGEKGREQFYINLLHAVAQRPENPPHPQWLIWVLRHEDILNTVVKTLVQLQQQEIVQDIFHRFANTCVGIVQTVDVAEESAQLVWLLEKRLDELDENFKGYKQLFESVFAIQEVVEDHRSEYLDTGM